jgi:hypothetical protein
MSANLLYKAFEQPESISVSASELINDDRGYVNRPVCIIDNPYAVGESNASMRLALSVRPTSDLGMKAFHIWARCSNSAGDHNWPNYKSAVACPSGKWTRLSGDIAVPSGMTTVEEIGIGVHAACTFDVLDFELWDGTDATKAVASHTPYATQGHLEAVYATQASLKVQSDRITSEVSARAQTDEAVSALSTRVTQTESGITTEITNRTAAVNQAKSDAISSANANTANALKSYTKTADLGDTDAVKDAKKAGTDAQSNLDSYKATNDEVVASHTTSISQLSDSITSAVSGSTTYTAPDGTQKTNTLATKVSQTETDVITAIQDAAEAIAETKDAKDTANEAQATANATATLIRQYADGVLVAKTGAKVGALVNANGSFDVVTLTWADGVPSVAGTLSSFDDDSASFLAGLVRIVAGKATMAGNLNVNSITIDAGDGVAAMHGIISRLEATINGVTSSVSAGWEQDFGYGVTAIVGESTAHLASDKAELRVGDNHMTMTQDGLTVDRLSFSKPPAWTVGRAVEDKCRAVYCVHGGTVFMSVNTDNDWWSIDEWVNVGPSLFSDTTGDSTTGVPPSLRPAERIYFPAATYSGDLLKGYVGTDGSIWLYHSGSVANWSFSVSWPVGGA